MRIRVDRSGISRSHYIPQFRLNGSRQGFRSCGMARPHQQKRKCNRSLGSPTSTDGSSKTSPTMHVLYSTLLRMTLNGNGTLMSKPPSNSLKERSYPLPYSPFRKIPNLSVLKRIVPTSLPERFYPNNLPKTKNGIPSLSCPNPCHQWNGIMIFMTRKCWLSFVLWKSGDISWKERNTNSRSGQIIRIWNTL